MQNHTKDKGTFDERGRRLDSVPLPPPDAATALSARAAAAPAQQVYLTAQALDSGLNNNAKSASDCNLRATWTAAPTSTYEYVYIYDHEPPQIGEEAGTPYTWARTFAPDGTQEASYLFGGGPEASLTYLCRFWVAYVRYDASGKYRIVARAPFRAGQSQWMANVLRDAPAWGNLKLDEIFIPGPHDSGTFDMVDRGIPNRYNQTQSLSFVDQLNAGARWLDIRMGYYQSYEKGAEGPFFTVHDVYGSWSAWSTALKDIAGWLASSPQEIVFLNFKWEGPMCENEVWKDANDNTVWAEALKTRVLQMSYDALKGHGVLPRSEHATATVNAMLGKNRHVVLMTASSYDPLSGTGPDGDPICPGVDYDWFDKYYITDLIPALDASLNKPRTWMWASGTVLTPHKYNGTIPWGVYSLTMDAIDRLNHWIRVNAGKLNVVSVDFMESSVVMPLVEAINKARV
ncbi:MAG: hypothetical protein U0359_16275 [Byssovorax sp.]